MKIKLIAISASLIISGCVTVKEVALQNEFNLSEAAYINKDGKNNITGNAFMRQRGGDVVTCAGSDVTLIPATKYAKERMLKMYGSESGGAITSNDTSFVKFKESPEQYLAMTKKTKCDSNGNFEFNNLADGEYYISTKVIWSAGYADQGGFLAHKVTLRNGKTEKIIMSK